MADKCTDGMTELGSQLKSLREAQGLSYEDIEKVTHIRPHLLKSIENGTVAEVAALVYARGLVKSYCEFLCADDLWQKYGGYLASPDPGPSEDLCEDPPTICHPTPMFRRSSMVWVYVVLVCAVLGAGFLLWKQHQEGGGSGFFLKMETPRAESQDVSPSGDQSLQIASVDSSAVSSGQPLSRDGASFPEESPDRPSVSGDLSWMDGGQSPAVVSGLSVSESPNTPVRLDTNLTIEVEARSTRLLVRQGDRLITQRTLGAGGKRTYRVTSETRVDLSSGNAASIVWLGRKYDRAGSDASPLSLLFRPDGSVSVISGTSLHFAASENPR